ncbi:MAG TPA: DUF1343 domain-containing protein [Bacteroidota bacterium]|nr:DUF1343 domain-containing protein [Bacteroidota bacterium]
MKFLRVVVPLLILAFPCYPQLHPLVKTGVDVLVSDGFAELKGKNVGLITNQTGVTANLEATADIFARADRLRLVALFAPEHGVRGETPAGRFVESYVDSATGLPVYSLYGKTTKPTPAMLKGIDALVYDIQDIGIRPYTFISTMVKGMEAAAENDIEFIVLDRPDPLTGERVEGNILDPRFRSFVGMLPIPYVYGMTCGELASMVNGEGWLSGGKKCRLKVVAMEGWSRTMTWSETGLPWVPTSPNIPTAETSLFCAATGAMGELNAISVGIGTTLPFQLVGAPWIDGAVLTRDLNRLQLPGVKFRQTSYSPFFSAMKGKQVNGVQIYLTDLRKVELVPLQLHIIETITAIDPTRKILDHSDSAGMTMFDKVMGTDAVRLSLAANVPVGKIVAEWKQEVERFLPTREKYLIYK